MMSASPTPPCALNRKSTPGETVLDLGIGVDMTDAMLEVALRNAPIVAERIGHSNVEFRKGRIEDLALDLAKLDESLRARPIASADAFLAAEDLAQELRLEHPLVATESVDVVVSNCVLNLVEPRAKRLLFEEIFRVLRLGGRAVISDIMADEEVPAELQADAELWSGCISGALTEEGFLAAFEETGFYGIHILKRDAEPWRTVRGLEFRSVAVEAWKGKQGPCFERNQAVIYKGPFKQVLDDDQHRLTRGRRQAVCAKTFQLYKKAPYREHFEVIEPLTPVPAEEALLYDGDRPALRHPPEPKGQEYDATGAASACCGSDGGCC